MILSAAMVSTLGFAGCPDLKALHNKVSPAVVRVEIVTKSGGNAHGTGLVATRTGTVVTSSHVIEGAEAVFVVTSKGKRFRYTLRKKGSPMSLSSIKPVKQFPPAYIPIGRHVPDVGDNFVLIGNPYNVGFFFATGMVSKVANKGRLVLSNMKSHPGFSGGFAFDCQGRPVGSVFGAYGSKHGVTILNGVLDIWRYKLLE